MIWMKISSRRALGNQRCSVALTLGSLVFAGSILACTPAAPVKGPDEVAETPLSPETQRAQKLLDELALSAIRASGRIDYDLFEKSPDSATFELNAAARERLDPDSVEPLTQALQAVKGDPIASRAFAEGHERARRYCAEHDCKAGDYRAELTRIEPPLDDSDVLVRVDFSGDEPAICAALAQFTLLYRLEGAEGDFVCPPPTAPRSLALRVGPQAASVLSKTQECKNGDPVPADASEGQCCYKYKKGRYYYGTFQPKPGGGLRCNL